MRVRHTHTHTDGQMNGTNKQLQILDHLSNQINNSQHTVSKLAHTPSGQLDY